MKSGRYLWGLLGAAALSGCEPASVTEARDQLGRGGPRDLVFTIPIRQDTITVAGVLTDFLDVEFLTILDSLVAVRVLPVSEGIAVADSVGTFTGVLDPATNPALTFDVVAWQEVPETNLDLGRFEDAVRNLSIETALVVLMVENTADAPITLSDFTVGVVRVDAATGDIRRDAGGDPLYEVDDMGQPILVRLPSSGGSDWTIPRTGTAVDTLSAGPLVDRLADLLLDGVRTAVVEAGTIVVGDGSPGTIEGGDSLGLTVESLLGFDFTFGRADVQFDSSTVRPGLNLDTASTLGGPDAVARLVDSAHVSLTISNGTPFVVEADIAAVEGDFAGDVFSRPDRVNLGSVLTTQATVDALGRAQAPGLSTSTLDLTGEEARVFFGAEFTSGVVVQLRAPSGGRGALRPGDRIVVDAAGRVRLHTGGGQ